MNATLHNSEAPTTTLSEVVLGHIEAAARTGARLFKLGVSVASELIEAELATIPGAHHAPHAARAPQADQARPQQTTGDRMHDPAAPAIVLLGVLGAAAMARSLAERVSRGRN